MTIDELLQIIPNAGARAGVFHGPLESAMSEFAIETPLDVAAFIATIAHESGSLRHVSENLNYSAEALLRVFRKYFTSSQTAVYARKPEAIANRVYANRMGNGDEASGDGWRYRGAGLIQLTGKNNQDAAADHFGVPSADVGDWMRTPEGAARSAGYYWSTNGLSAIANEGDFIGVSAVVNTGKRTTPPGRINGLADRQAFYERAKQVLGA